MRYLADTTFLIDLVNGVEGAVNLAKGFDESNDTVFLSVVSVEEYFRGIYYLYLDDESLLKRKLRAALRDLSPFEILPVTYEVALKAAEIDAKLVKKGLMLSMADILIAASAIVNDLILVTRNIRHFNRIEGVKTITY